MATSTGLSSKELLEAQSHLWNHIFSFINSLSLKCALELGIPDAVYNHGKPITLTDLSSALSIPPVRIPNFQRIMRLLVHNGFFTEETEDVYGLTVNSTLLIKDKWVLHGWSDEACVTLLKNCKAAILCGKNEPQEKLPSLAPVQDPPPCS